MSGQVEEADVGALLAKLRAELAASEYGSTETEAGWVPARREAGRLAAVSGDREFFRRPGLLGRVRGLVLVPPKLVLRKLVRWYVEPIAAEQRAFNTAALRLVDDVTAWTAAQVEDVHRNLEYVHRSLDEVGRKVNDAGDLSARLERRGSELEDRLLRVERRPAAALPPRAGAQVPSATPATQAPFDYFAFEGRMREGRDEIRRRQAPYVDDFRDAGPVLDVGCGRGEFLTLLREAGVEARGVDLDADMVAFCRGEGLDVEQADAVEWLAGLEDASLGGIFGAHVVEHMPPESLVRFLSLAGTKLRPGARLVLETPNPVSLVALKHYFADLTHSQPLVPETLAFLVRQAGFQDVEIRYLSEVPEHERLRPVELPAEPQLADAQRALDANVTRLNDVVFGPQDYAVAARR